MISNPPNPQTRFSNAREAVAPQVHFLALLLTATLLTGCRQAHVTQTVPPSLFGNDPDAQIDFWHTLADKPITDNDEAFHGLLLYLDNQDTANDYAGRVAALRSRNMLPRGFNQPADAAIQRGVLAVAICQALQIKGGVTMHILNPIVGPTPRYCLNELQFMGLYPPGSANQTFSGDEYLGIIGKVEDYQRGDPARKPAAYMPDQSAPSK